MVCIVKSITHCPINGKFKNVNIRRHCEVLQRLRLEKKLEVHQGCVNTVAWNRFLITNRYKDNRDRQLITSDETYMINLFVFLAVELFF